MCGIAGIAARTEAKVQRAQVTKMTDAISHRGPDGEGVWLSAEEHIGLGHRRLSILDLSECGAQPMHYMDRYSIVFNGEIYNYLEIREDLVKRGYQFKSTSDTEVLMAVYHDRKERCLQSLDGMFAFAIYDAEEQTLFLARDRFGEKPLFYAYTEEGNLLFASEMKALWATGLPKKVNEQLLYNYLLFNALEEPEDKSLTFYANIFRFPAAHYATYTHAGGKLQPKRYWDISLAEKNHGIGEKEAAARFEELFYTSINRRLRSDVPVGSSLSGGLDSSLVVCAIDQVDKERQMMRKTFSAQFPGFSKDESYFQKLVIDQCHVDPHFVYPSAESMLANLGKVMYHQEEPFSSASICAQYEVFGLAKTNGVTVLLDGQGADEILAGYHYYYPYFFNGISGTAKKKEWNAFQSLQREGYSNIRLENGWKSAVKNLIPQGVQEKLFTRHRKETSGHALLNSDFAASFSFRNPQLSERASLSEALYFNTMKSGLEILLRYADRNSMAHSREVRLPFLYHELVAFLFSLPDEFKIRDGWTKWIMRKTFDKLLPGEITWRKDKIGYEPPQKKWMEQPAMVAEIRQSVQDLVDQRILSPRALEGGDTNNLQWKSFVISKTLFSEPNQLNTSL